MRQYFVYIMSSINQTIYIGVTNNLVRRVFEHQQGAVKGFTKKYRCTRLIYYEIYSDVRLAISREKQLKSWRRSKKNTLIEELNPHWDELYPTLG